MVHTFDSDVAVKYGMLEAVIFQNICFWVSKNKANGTHYHDGRYWTYNSIKAFSELFPYVTSRQIEGALKHLRDEGVLLTGDYNESRYDRTMWYALSDLGESISHTAFVETRYSVNRDTPQCEPIPDNKPDNKQQIKNTDIYNAVPAEKTVVRFVPPTVEEVRAYCTERNNGIDAEAFVAYYDSVGWMVGNKKMKQWKSAVITWEKKNRQSARNSTSNGTRDHSEFYKNTGEWSS